MLTISADYSYLESPTVVNLKGRICISEVYQQGGMSYIPYTISSKSRTDERRREEEERCVCERVE